MLKRWRKERAEKNFKKNFKKCWRQKNSHNEIEPVNIETFPIEKVEVGRYSYGPIIVHSWGHIDEKLKIGSFVSIASGVKFLLGGNHEINTFTTYPFKVKFLNKDREAGTRGPIIVEDYGGLFCQTVSLKT